jgi:hypothetical protein
MRNAFSKFFLSSVLMLSMPIVAGSCIQPVDPDATKDVAGAVVRKPDFTPMTTIVPTERPIQLAPGDDGGMTADPCEKTKSDKDAILKVFCGNCHDLGDKSLGLPPFGFLLDDQALVSTTIMKEGSTTPQPFVMPGSPSQSLLYVRVATRTMPPEPKGLDSALPAPTLSDISVLSEWITHCVPGAPPANGTGGATAPSNGTGGSSGSGGSTGSGGNSGTGGGNVSAPDAGQGASGGTGQDAGGVATDGGTDAVLAMCANNVANGAGCGGQAPCRMANLTCTCMGGGGARRWACR